MLKNICLLFAFCWCATALHAQRASAEQDTLRMVTVVLQDDSLTTIPEDAVVQFDTIVHNPRKAVLYSAVCPGLGQAYNRKYWKIPIVYGAFMGLSYGIIWNHQYFKDYKNGYVDFLQGIPNQTWQNLIVEGKETDPAHLAWVRKVLKQKRDRYRRWRDMCIIGMAGVYALNIIDAFVDAQLIDFDISEDLSLNVSPSIMHTSDIGNSYGLHFQLHF